MKTKSELSAMLQFFKNQQLLNITDRQTDRRNFDTKEYMPRFKLGTKEILKMYKT